MGVLIRIVAGRLLQALGAAWLIGTLCFALAQALPGDLASEVSLARYGDRSDEQLVRKVQAELRMDTSLLIRYGHWLGSLALLNLGHSSVSGEPVAKLLKARWRNTLEIAIPAFLLSLTLAWPLGFAAGMGRLERLSRWFSAALTAIPSFVLGVALIGIFAVYLAWFPPAGAHNASHRILPVVTLALGLAAVSNRIVRDSVATHWRSPAVEFARLKGLATAQVVKRHLLPLVLPSVFSFSSIQFVFLLDGFVVIESLFAYPGLGDLLVTSVIQRDIPVIQGIAVTIGFVFVALNAATEMVLVHLDPRQGLALEGE